MNSSPLTDRELAQAVIHELSRRLAELLRELPFDAGSAVDFHLPEPRP